MNETFLGLAALGLLGVPTAGAVLLWLVPGRGLLARSRGPLTAATVALLAAALGGAIAIVAAAGPVSSALPLGAFAPHEGFAATAWTLGPALFSVLFLLISVRARSARLVALALLQGAVALPVTVRELVEAPGSHAGDGLLLDPLALALLVVSVGVGGVIVVYSLGYQPEHLRHAGGDPARTHRFLAWLLIFLAGMHLLVLADDLRLLTVGWEVTTLCSYVLIGFDRTPEAKVAAERALAYNLFGGAALALAAWMAGSGASLSALIADPQASLLPLILAAMAVAAATKSALAPFHPWLLGAMVAAAPVSALLHASTMVKAGSYLLLRLSPLMHATPVGMGVAVLGGLSFSMAAFLALRERDLKRVLALSTVASLGLIAASAGLGSPLALAAGVVFLLLHGVAKGLAFLVVGANEQATGTRDLETLVGLGRARPMLAAPLLLAAAAMALPPFGIAATKWAILLAGSGDVPVVLLLAVGAATNVALWTSVVSRILVRRPVQLPSVRSETWPVRWSIAALAIGTAGGLLLSGPLASWFGDSAATSGFGRSGPLASGWSLQAAGGIFPVLALVAAVGLAAVVAFAAVARLRTSPAPYLGGTNVTGGTRPAFHGPRGEAQMATSGGFYWGAALGGGADPFGLRRAVLIGGWLVAAALAALALMSVAGWV